MTTCKCSYEECPNPATFLVPQIAPERACGWIWLPVCAEDRASWWEGGDYTEANCPMPTLPLPAQAGGMPIGESREFIIRDFATGIDEDDEKLYWNDADGWVDRDSATRFREQEIFGVGLPTIGAEPGWVAVADAQDTRYRPA